MFAVFPSITLWPRASRTHTAQQLEIYFFATRKTARKIENTNCHHYLHMGKK